MRYAHVLSSGWQAGRAPSTTLKAMKKLLVLAIVGAVIAAIVYKVMSSEVPIDVQS